MADLLIWGGPVSTADVAKVAWERPTKVLVYNSGPDGGIGSSSFSKLADSVRGKDGRILPGLLALRGEKPENFDRIAIAGFSAFHGLASPLLDADADRISAAVLHDACFSSLANPPKKGYLKFGELAARGERLMVFTSSLGGGDTYSTGSACAQVNFTEAAKIAGVPVVPYDPPQTVPPPATGTSARAGDLILIDYGSEFTHVQHVTKLAVPVLDALLVPYLAGDSLEPMTRSGPAPASAGPWIALAIVVAGAGAIYLAKRSR